MGRFAFAATACDHHSAGWQACSGRISPGAARPGVQIPLSSLVRFLGLLEEWCLRAGLPSLRIALFDQENKIWEIVALFGTQIANSNSKSYSRESIGTRITNSSWKEGESQPGAPGPSDKSPGSPTNTKYEEHAP